MFEMRVVVLLAGLMLVSSIPYMTGEIRGSTKVESQQLKSQARLSASEYIEQMGPNTPSWKKYKPVKEASAEPLK